MHELVLFYTSELSFRTWRCGSLIVLYAVHAARRVCGAKRGWRILAKVPVGALVVGMCSFNGIRRLAQTLCNLRKDGVEPIPRRRNPGSRWSLCRNAILRLLDSRSLPERLAPAQSYLEGGIDHRACAADGRLLACGGAEGQGMLGGTRRGAKELDRRCKRWDLAGEWAVL
jgi:hypothetical protein